MKHAVVLLLLVDLALTWNANAYARARTDLPYDLDAAFSTAVRFVRIDKGCKLIDKDAQAAFVTFACDDGAQEKRGALELFKVPDGVRAQITLGDDTHGMELRWLELYERKLRDEHGTPPPRPRPAPAASTGKAGATSDKTARDAGV